MIPREFSISRLTATGLRSTAPLFEKLRDETCLHECLLSSCYRILLSLPPFFLFLSRSVPLSSPSSLPPSLQRTRFDRFFVDVLPLAYIILVRSLSLSRPHPLNPFDHLPRGWKVYWFARWPVVSTPLHMVTYHQSTPATRFALRTPWIFMGRNVFRGHRASSTERGISGTRVYR